MNHFHVCKKLKSILLVALSVAIMVCSIPFTSFKSYALAPSTYLTFEALLPFLTYMATRGYSIIGSDETPSSALDWSYAPVDMIDSTLKSIGNGLDRIYPGLGYGTSFLRALNIASQTGRLTLSQTLSEALDNYFYSNTVNNSLSVGEVEFSLDTLAFVPNSSYTVGNTSVSISPVSLANLSYPCIPVQFTLDNSDYLFLMPNSVVLSDPASFLSKDGNGYYSVFISLSTNAYVTFTINNIKYKVFYLQSRSNLVFNTNFTSYYSDDYVGTSVGNIISLIYAAFLNNELSIIEANLSSDQVTDTSSLDILTSSSVVDSTDASVSGPTTLYLPDESSLIELLDAYSTQSITYNELLEALKISSVSSSANADTKENALSDVVLPDSTYAWLTGTMWGANTITQTNEDIQEHATTQSDLLEQTASQYGSNDDLDNSENENKGGLAMLLGTILLYLGLWHSPNYDPTAPDPGGLPDDEQTESDRSAAADVISGVGVAATMVSAIFDSAGGSSRYGMIFTVGASFVLFSVIIGAGHFLGGLGNSAEVKAKAADREVVRETHRNNLANSQLKLEMTQRRYNKGK